MRAAGIANRSRCKPVSASSALGAMPNRLADSIIDFAARTGTAGTSRLGALQLRIWSQGRQTELPNCPKMISHCQERIFPKTLLYVTLRDENRVEDPNHVDHVSGVCAAQSAFLRRCRRMP